MPKQIQPKKQKPHWLAQINKAGLQPSELALPQTHAWAEHPTVIDRWRRWADWWAEWWWCWRRSYPIVSDLRGLRSWKASGRGLRSVLGCNRVQCLGADDEDVSPKKLPEPRLRSVKLQTWNWRCSFLHGKNLWSLWWSRKQNSILPS